MPPHGCSMLGVFRPLPEIPATASAGASGAVGHRIWQGHLRVRGHRNHMLVSCVAERYSIPDRQCVRDASGWPSTLSCDSSKLKQWADVTPCMNEPRSQWYVRLAPVDGNGAESLDAKLVQSVKVLVERQLAFEISCEEASGTRGTLYLWGMVLPCHGYSLLAVFRPSVIPSLSGGEMNDVNS